MRYPLFGAYDEKNGKGIMFQVVFYTVVTLMILSMGFSFTQFEHNDGAGSSHSLQSGVIPLVSTRALSLSLQPTLTSGAQADDIIIYANVTYNGAGVSGVSVTFTDTNGNSFLPSTITTNSTGVGIVTYSIISSNQASDTVSALANLSGYLNATASVVINDVSSTNNLGSSITLAASEVSSGSTDVISGHVQQDGFSVSGASVTISSPIYSIFSPFTITTDSNGNYHSNFTVGSVSYPETSIIEVTVSASGYGSSSSDTTINVEPSGHGYLSVSVMQATPSNPSQNGYMTISARVSSAGTAMAGVTVSFTDSFGSTFSPLSDVTNSSGLISANVHLSDSNSGYDTIRASASKTGYITSDGESIVYVSSGGSQLTVTGSLKFATINSNETDSISGNVYTSGSSNQINGAQLTATDTVGSKFLNLPTYSENGGSYEMSFVLPSVTKITNDTITITASYSGDVSVSSSFMLTILPANVKSLNENLTLSDPTASIAVGDTEQIQVYVTANGHPVSGASVAFTDSFGSSFGGLSGATNASGILIENVHFSSGSYGIDLISATATISGYYEGQTSMEVDVLQGLSNQLSVTAGLGVSTITSNGTDVISGTVFDGGNTGNQVTGATISVSDTANSMFHSASTLSGQSGSFYFEFNAAVVNREINDTIILTVSEAGYTGSSSSMVLTILPGNSGSLSVVVSEVYPTSGMVSNGQGIATILVESAGKPVDNSLVSVSDTAGSTFEPPTVTTNLTGIAHVSFNIPGVINGQTDIITASASASGYNGSSGESYFYVSGASTSQLGVRMVLQAAAVSPGSTVVITGQTYTFYNPFGLGLGIGSVGGVTVTFSDSAGSTFSNPTVISSSSGNFITNLTIPKNFKGTFDVITATASMTGHPSGTSAVSLNISNSLSSATFVESGLPSGTSWSVTFDASSESSSGNATVFYAPNGMYTYSVSSIPGYKISPSSGTVTLTDSGVRVNISFVQVYFPITFIESGLASGTQWSVNLSGTVVTSTSNSITFNEMNGTYGYKILPVPGYTISSVSGTITSNGGFNQYLTFQQVLYTVTLKENGLPTGYYWSATLGTYKLSSDSNLIQFSVPNGTYPYAVNVPTGYLAANQTGSVTVSGTGMTQEVTFTANLFVKYHATFNVTGLPTSVVWTLEVNGNSTIHNVDSFSINLPAGNYTYMVNASEFVANKPAGSFNISTSNITIDIVFSASTKYSVEFQESGLSSGQQWNVSLNGVTNESTGTSIQFYESNGNYTFVVQAPAGYTVNPSSGTIKVSSGNENIALYFQKTASNSRITKYSVMFIESGLPSGAPWSLTFNGSIYSTSTTSIYDLVLNGTYTFNITSVSGYEISPPSGSVVISGQDEIVGITFQKVAVSSKTGYNITFIESGLPQGESWQITFNGQPLSSTGTAITVSEFNGTYSYTIGSISGYSISPDSGLITINGHNVIIGVNFVLKNNVPSSSSGSNILGIPLSYVLAGLVTAVIVGSVLGAVAGAHIRKRP